MVHSPFPQEYSYPVVHHIENMSSKLSFNDNDNNMSKKRKQDFQFPMMSSSSVNDYYQKSQFLYSQQQQQQQQQTSQYNNLPYQLTSAATTWNDYIRSNPSTPTNSPPQSTRSDSINLPDYIISDNLSGNLSLSASDSIYGFESLYNNPFASINASLPLNTISDFDNTTNFGYGDIPDPSIGNSPISSSDSTYEEIMCDNHQIESNLDSSDDQDNSQKNSSSVTGLYDPLAGLATAASMISCNRDSVNGEVDARNRRPHLVLDIKPNAYDFGYIESLSSSPSSAVTMPPTPVYFDVTNSTLTDGYTFFQTDQSGSIFTADKINENPQTVSPAAVTFTPNYASMITPNATTLDSEHEYFNQQFHSRSQPRRRKSISTSNPQNIKTEPRTPALSPPESPNESISSACSSPPSPSSPHTPSYKSHKRKISTIMEEEEDILTSSVVNNVGNISLVTSGFANDMTNTINPGLTQSATTSIMRHVIQQYLNSSNPATMGEKTVMVLTSKVAQKSYGTEKRFLCPPPTTLILGTNWWSPTPNNINHSTTTSTTYSPPKISVGISGEQGHQSGILEWISPSGNPLDPNSCSEMAFSGKCVSKHLYINDADEKRKRVEVLVNIQSPMGHNFGTFASKPIKVISKPSKKRQSVKNMELCIHHGTTISLFNRIRSQTVSTKYLGVSMQNANQTFGPWNYGSNHISPNPNEQPHPCFVARTGSWDPFIIWIVDPNYVKSKDDHSPQQSSNPNFPRPPPAAIKSTNGNPIPIHYNQPIVLQCLTTGMTSPIMVIRKVDKGSMVIGGGIVENVNGLGEAAEALGDPVSQLHKVAFQIKDTNVSSSLSTSPTFHSTNNQHLPGPGTYLACLGDIVGMQRANEGRKIIAQPSALSINTNFLDMKTTTSTSSSSDLPAKTVASWAATDFPSSLAESAAVSMEGGRIIRKRRVSSVLIRPQSQLKSALAKNRRRGNSLSGVASEVDLAKFAANARNSTNHRNHDNAGALWTEDVTDAAVWTIVGTDCASYTFYSPQNIVTSPSHHLSSFLPSTPVTPLPKISNIVSATTSPIISSATSSVSVSTSVPSLATSSANNSSQGHQSTTPNTITIYGENFTRDLIVWFGDIPSPRIEFRSKDCLVCWLPDELVYEMEHPNNNKQQDIGLQGRHLPIGRVGTTGKPILLSRGDGVVFKTEKFWS